MSIPSAAVALEYRAAAITRPAPVGGTRYDEQREEALGRRCEEARRQAERADPPDRRVAIEGLDRNAGVWEAQHQAREERDPEAGRHHRLRHLAIVDAEDDARFESRRRAAPVNHLEARAVGSEVG